MTFVALTSSASAASTGYIDARATCAADGVTDDRAAFATVIAAALALNVRTLELGSATYRVSKYVDIANAYGLRIVGRGARIIYASGDTSVVTDSTATSRNMARSGLLLRYCSGVTIEGVTFVGDSVTDIQVQLGSGVYATHCVDVSLIACNQILGASLIQQDVQGQTTGTGDSLSVNGTTVTLTDAAAAFKTGHGCGARFVTITNATNPTNNGIFRILSATSTTITFTNAAAVAEPSSSFRWAIDDDDRGLRVLGGRSLGTRKALLPTNNSVVDGHTFELPDTADVTGIGDSFTISGSTVTLKDHSRRVSTRHIGKYITIPDATSPGNRGTFLITSVTPKSGNNPASIVYTNASGVTELYTGSWWIANGEKTGVGGASGAFTIDGGTVTVDVSTNVFTRVAHGYVDATNVRFSGVLPDGISAVDYYVIRLTADTFKVAETVNDVAVGTAVDVTAINGVFSVSAGTRLTLAASTFSTSDVTKNIRILGATSNGNKGTFTITLVSSGTSVTYANWSGVAEAFTAAGCQWTIDGYDRVGGTTSGNGSSHAVYVFAGRSNVKVVNCAFMNIRAVAVKASGSSAPVENIFVANNYFFNCGAAATWGADDSCEHRNMTFTDNVVVDCAANRVGWSEGAAVGILGSSNVIISNNQFNYTQNNIATVDGTGIGATSCISVSRYVVGASQPVEGVTIDGNSWSVDPLQTAPNSLMTYAINAVRVGQRTHYDTAGVLSKSGNTMTLTANTAILSPQLVGRPVQFVNCTNALNDGTYTIESVPSGTTLTFTNAAGVVGTLGGTYRIFPDRAIGTWTNSNHRGGHLRISGNTFDNVCNTLIQTTGCVSPTITDNEWAFGAIASTGDLMPVIRRNKSLATNTNSAQIQLTSPVWPIVADNMTVPVHAFATSISARDMTIGLGLTVVDYPLLGTRGRVRPTNAYEEIVLAYGYDHVDGDTIEVGATTYTYKASGPTGNQFNSQASLMALIDAQAGFDCADYGTGFAAGSIATGKLRIRRTAQSTSDGTTFVRTSPLNPTALVMLRNDQGASSSRCASRGAGSAGPIPDKTVVWSPLAGHTSVVSLVPDNAVGRTILAGSFLQGRNASDSGACAVMQTNRTDDGSLVDAGAEFRFAIAG